MSDKKYTGVTVTQQYLTVHFEDHQGTALRFGTIKVPIMDLIDDEILYQIYKAAAKALRLAWEDNGEVIPLFDV